MLLVCGHAKHDMRSLTAGRACASDKSISLPYTLSLTDNTFPCCSPNNQRSAASPEVAVKQGERECLVGKLSGSVSRCVRLWVLVISHSILFV